MSGKISSRDSMHKIKIYSIGKTKEKWLEEAIQEYTKRLKPILEIEYIWAKDDPQLIRLVEKEPLVLCLDPQGKMMTSDEFSTYLHNNLQQGGSRLALVIGGAEGLPQKFRETYPLLSLSRMTLTHQCTRLFLIEQIYRAFEIAKGTSYHK